MTHENLLNDVRDALADIVHSDELAQLIAERALAKLDAFLIDVPDLQTSLAKHDTFRKITGMECDDIYEQAARLLHTATTEGNDDD